MRIYSDCYQLISEVMREVYEMGAIVKPKSMQNKDVSGDSKFETKEIINYSYALTSRDREEYLFISDPRSKAWVRAEFIERTKYSHLNPGSAWEIRPEIWGDLLVNKRTGGGDVRVFDYTYNQRINPGLTLPKLVGELQRNPDTRQAILCIWDRGEDIYGIGGKKRVPCSIYYQFLLRDGKLHIIYNQRSADVITHFGNDIWLAWELMTYVANLVGVDPGFLYHNIASLHAYRKDWDTLKTCIEDRLTLK